MTVRQIAVVITVVFVVTLAVVVGKQMSTEAMAVVIGIVCGVAAGIPTSVLLLVALTRRERQRMEAEEAERQTRQANYPPVVVIQGGTPQAIPPMPSAGYWPAQVPTPRTTRRFHIVGGDELSSGDED